MAETITPRQIVKGLLEGVAPPRPLFLPIVFSHGARIENLPVRTFLTNPTKISNSLRQIRAYLHSDGITCYFDPFLEAEELGGVLHWEDEGRAPKLGWPQKAAGGLPPGRLPLPTDPAKGSRVAVAVEVIRRLKSVVRDDCLLTAGVSGPFTLAALLSQLNPNDSLQYSDLASSALDLAAAVISGIAKAFVEAGANVILIREDILPPLSAEDAADWAMQLATTINIIRFYQALPVILLTHNESVRTNRDVIFRQDWDCVVCPVLDAMLAEGAAGFPEPRGPRFGVALGPETFLTGESGSTEIDRSVERAVSELRPAIITTTADVAGAADVERLNKLWENVRR
jgi:hypothetical protein